MGVGGTGAREAAGEICRDDHTGQGSWRHDPGLWILGRGLQPGGMAGAAPAGMRGGGARVAAGRWPGVVGPRSGRRRAGSVFALQTPKGMLASLCVTRALAGLSGGGLCSECGLQGPSG